MSVDRDLKKRIDELEAREVDYIMESERLASIVSAVKAWREHTQSVRAVDMLDAILRGEEPGGGVLETAKTHDTDVLPGGIGEIAGASMLGDIGACDGDLDFDSPTPEDLYVAAVSLASDLVNEGPTSGPTRKIERAALWIARVAVEHASSEEGGHE